MPHAASLVPRKPRHRSTRNVGRNIKSHKAEWPRINIEDPVNLPLHQPVRHLADVEQFKLVAASAAMNAVRVQDRPVAKVTKVDDPEINAAPAARFWCPPKRRDTADGTPARTASSVEF